MTDLQDFTVSVGDIKEVSESLKKKTERHAVSAANEIRKRVWLAAYSRGEVVIKYEGKEAVKEGERVYRSLMNFRAGVRKRRLTQGELYDKLEQVVLGQEYDTRHRYTITLRRAAVEVSLTSQATLNLLKRGDLDLMGVNPDV